jgi:hypothetical protein
LERRHAQAIDGIYNTLTVLQLIRLLTQWFQLHDRREKLIRYLKVLWLLAHNLGERLIMALICKGGEEGGFVFGDDKGPNQRPAPGYGQVLNHAVGQHRRLRGQADDGREQRVRRVGVLGGVDELLVDQLYGGEAVVERLGGVVGIPMPREVRGPEAQDCVCQAFRLRTVSKPVSMKT